MEYIIGLVLSLAVAGAAARPYLLSYCAHRHRLVLRVMRASGRVLIVEIIVASGILLFAVLGFKRNLWLVAGAFVGHGVFDFVHHLFIDNAGVPRLVARFLFSI